MAVDSGVPFPTPGVASGTPVAVLPGSPPAPAVPVATGAGVGVGVGGGVGAA